MDDNLVHSANKPPPSGFALITPSASPPGSRVWRKPDRPPALKRPRLSSTPSSASSSIRPSSSSSNVSDLRLESSSKLFQFWDQLAGRYNKPLDEDDIVDLRDLAIVKDRGVTRAAEKTYEIGSLTVLDTDPDPDDVASQGAETEEGAGEGEDDSADELDLISPPTVPVKLEYYKSWYVPPADETNPEDAEAFREFEEAEKKRKELYGEDDEDEDAVITRSEEEEEDPSVRLEEPSEQVEPNVNEDTNERFRSPSPKARPQRRKSRPPSAPGDDSSEDELATWIIDDTPIPPRRSIVPSNDDIIDLTLSRSPSPVRRGRSLSRLPPCAPNRAHSRVRSKSSIPAAPKHPQTPTRPPSPKQALQLLTPPRSSSAMESDLGMLSREPPPPAQTPSPKFPKPRPRYTPKPRIPSRDEADKHKQDQSATAESMKSFVYTFPVGPLKKVAKAMKKPEVVITTLPKKLNEKTMPPHASSPDTRHSPSVPVTNHQNTKGKAKELQREPPSPESASNASRPRRSQSQPREPTEESSSPQPQPTRGLKRRRVSSLSSLSDGSPTKAATAPLADPSSARNPHHTRSKSGYSSDVPLTSYPVRDDDEDEGSSRRPNRSRSRARTAAPQLFPTYPLTYPFYTPRHDDHPPASSRRNSTYDYQQSYQPAVPIQDPQAQMLAQDMLAQAWSSLSYLMTSGMLQPPPPASGYPPGLPFPPAPWPPYTPSHQRHLSHPFYGTLSSEAGPSRSSVYSTPAHQPHPYPYSLDPRYSSGTLPPSSPIASSAVDSSPILRPASVAPGQRSRSRGRRVSFKLDANDRPIPPSSPAHVEDSDEEDAATSTRGRLVGASASAKSRKGKGKARAESEVDEDDPLGLAVVIPARGRAPQRARTPGPPSQRGKSAQRTEPKVSKKELKDRKGKGKE